MLEPDIKVRKITDRPVKYTCEICGHTVVKPSPESLPQLSMLSGLFYVCNGCGKVVCRSCTTKKKKTILCKNCVVRHSPARKVDEEVWETIASCQTW